MAHSSETDTAETLAGVPAADKCFLVCGSGYQPKITHLVAEVLPLLAGDVERELHALPFLVGHGGQGGVVVDGGDGGPLVALTGLGNAKSWRNIWKFRNYFLPLQSTNVCIITNKSSKQ